MDRTSRFSLVIGLVGALGFVASLWWIILGGTTAGALFSVAFCLIAFFGDLWLSAARAAGER